MYKERRVKGGRETRNLKERGGEEGKRRGKGKGRKEEGRSGGKDKEKFKKDPKTMIMSALTSLTLPITTKKVLQVLDLHPQSSPLSQPSPHLLPLLQEAAHCHTALPLPLCLPLPLLPSFLTGH